MKRSPIQRRTPLNRTRMPRTRPDTGPSADTKQTVWKRDAGRCARCGNPLAGGNYSRQHRKPRAMGGTSRAEINCAANLVMLCGSATTGCHGFVESHREEGRRLGYLVSSWADPHTVPVWRCWRQEWVLLDCDGGVTRTEEAA